MRWIWLLFLSACNGGKDSATTESAPPSVDLDQDGYDALDAGGSDCDDSDPAIHPGATETWYDGVDQDCRQDSDFDQDQDNQDSDQYGGTDCDDTNANVYLGAAEYQDGLDQDCDGLADEDFANTGLLLITEVHHSPVATDASAGEWVEIYNPTSSTLEIQGWTFQTLDTSWTIEQSLQIPPLSRRLLGASADLSANGGVTLDLEWSGLSLDATDRLSVWIGPTEIAALDWSGGDWPAAEGASLSLDPDHQTSEQMTSPTWWCTSTTTFGAGDQGTPGNPNDHCTTIDEDGDGFTTDQGDCNDSSPDIHPDATESWDNLDNNCDGVEDNAAVTDVRAGWLDGDSGWWLGTPAGVSVGDVTADGLPEMFANAEARDSDRGAAYAVNGSQVGVVAGLISDYDFISIEGVDVGHHLGAMGPVLGDQTGDGYTDLAVAGGLISLTPIVIAVFTGNTYLFGTYTPIAAPLRISGGHGSANQRLLSHLDLTGDGVAELVYGDSEADGGRGRVDVLDVAGVSGDLSLGPDSSVLTGNSGDDRLGLALGGGDLDGDGYDDVMLGAPGHTAAGGAPGAWVVVSGGTLWTQDTINDYYTWKFYGTDSVGLGAGGAVVIDQGGTPTLALGSFSGGTVYLFAAPTPGFVDVADANQTLSGDGAFGASLQVGDLNGDAQDELIVGAPAWGTTDPTASWREIPGTGTGTVYVYADLSSPALSVSGATSGDLFGAVLSGAADLDSDGLNDLLVAAPGGASDGGGRVYTLRGWGF